MAFKPILTLLFYELQVCPFISTVVAIVIINDLY